MGDQIDPRHIGVPNINFSLAELDDKREENFAKQRIARGFDDTETWSLRDTIGLFILPRLIRYREIADGFIKVDSDDTFFEDIDKSIKAFELLTLNNGAFLLSKEEEKEYEDGMESFHRVFLRLWW